MKLLLMVFLAAGFALTGWGADKMAWNVRDFGATGNGTTKDTAAIQKALDTCAAAGGGSVLMPKGDYLTGSIVIGPNTKLELAGRANLIGSPDIADYPIEKMRWEGEYHKGHRALISASNAPNIAISGHGTIFGPPLSLSRLRNPRGPVLIELTGCTNALLEEFTTQYQQLWSIHLVFCKDLTARGLTIRSVNFNGDGIDVDSCSGVTIEHCDINTGDDAIALKSGRGLAAQNLARPTENVLIRDCNLHSSIYAGLALGTEMSGGIRNITIQNCIISGRQNAIFIKSRDGRGGYMENISGENLTVLKSPTFIGINLLNKGIQATDPVPGKVDQWARVGNISFKNVQVTGVTDLVDGTDVPDARPLNGFTLANISGTCAHGIAIANMKNVKLSKIQVTGYSGPLINAQNVTGSGLNLSASK